MWQILRIALLKSGMAIPVGTNDLRIYRRHASYCTRYSGLKSKPDTYRPVTKKDQKVDTCQCPIWCRGYLAKETKFVNGKQREKRIFASLATRIGAPPNRRSPACTIVVRVPPSNLP